MSKRFIDSGLFDDPWFMDLSNRAKLFWILLITKCNHAGIIKANDKLFKFYLSVNSLDTVYKELSNRLIEINDHYIFIPKYIQFQYPKGLQDNVKAQLSAKMILREYSLWDEEKQTVREQLGNSYLTVQDKNKNMNMNKSKVLNIAFDVFWNTYDYKDDRNRCLKLWEGSKKLETGKYLTDQDRVDIMKHVPLYVENTPNKEYRKKPDKYLYHSLWHNEIIKSKPSNKRNNQPIVGRYGEPEIVQTPEQIAKIQAFNKTTEKGK